MPADLVTSLAGLTLSRGAILVTGGLVLATGVLFGLYPALHSTRLDLVGMLKSSTGQASSRAERPVQLWLTEPAAFIASVTSAARAVLSHCDARGWWNRDTEELRRTLESGDEHQVR